MSRNQKIIVAIGLLIVAAIVFAVTGGGGHVEVHAQNQHYFYDLTSGQLFEAESARPPIDAPGGANQGVLAHVVGCGSCAEAGRHIAYVKTYSPEAIAAFKQPPPKDPDAGQLLAETVARGTLVAAPPTEGSDIFWVPELSPDGEQVIARTSTLCSGKTPQVCRP